MKKFKFQFEAVEKIRKIRQDEAMRFLAEAQKKHQDYLDQKAELLEEIERSWKRRDTFVSHAQSPLEFQMEDEYLNGLKHRVRQTEHMIDRTKKFVTQAMIKYLQARKQSQVVEKLRENAVGEYRVSYNKYQLKQLDDLNTMRNRLKKGAA